VANVQRMLGFLAGTFASELWREQATARVNAPGPGVGFQHRSISNPAAARHTAGGLLFGPSLPVCPRCNACLASRRERSQANSPGRRFAASIRSVGLGVAMNISSSNDEGLLSLWESVRRQVAVDRSNGGRSRFVGANLRAYAESIRSEMDRRELSYTPIEWSE